MLTIKALIASLAGFQKTRESPLAYFVRKDAGMFFQDPTIIVQKVTEPCNRTDNFQNQQFQTYSFRMRGPKLSFESCNIFLKNSSGPACQKKHKN